MPTITQHAPGAFCWPELGTTDQNAAKAFYSGLFGWTFRDTPMGPGVVYTIFQLDGRDAAALYTLEPNVLAMVASFRRAGSALIGTYDFSAFTVANSEVEDHVRTIIRLDIDREPNEISILVSADGFLRYMVRTIVGTLIEVGRGNRTAASVTTTLISCDRANAGPTAPANGLTLVRVDY
jgi:tRNA U38,U39,U40 pseudouridine synthase TruA